MLLVLVVLALLAVALWWLLRRRRQRSAAPAGSQPSLARQVTEAGARFYRDLPARAHHLPTVLVLGDAGVGKSHVIGSRVDWRSQANQFFPSALGSPQLQLYLGSDVVVHELSAPLLRDLSRDTRRALSRLWRNVGPSTTAVVVVDARALVTTPPETLRELAQLVRGKLGALPARARDTLELRVCLSHMDHLEGYDELVAVLGAHHGPLDVGPLCHGIADASALLQAARTLMARYDANLAYGLTHRKSDSFASLVGFYSTFPVLLTQLAPLLSTLTGGDADQPSYPPSGLYLSALVPDAHVGDPFTVNQALVGASITRQRQRHRRGALATAALGLLAVIAMMGWHHRSVAAAELASASYVDAVSAGRPAGDVQLRQVAADLRAVHTDEFLWLDRSFIARKRALEALFSHALRKQHLLPKLQVNTSDLSTMLYVVALIYAADDNGLRALILDHIDLWVTKVRLPLLVVSTYLEVTHRQYQVAEPFDPAYHGSDWQSYIYDRVRPLYDQPRRLTQAQLDELLRDPPQLHDAREYAVREQIIELLSAQVALATHPPIAKLIESPLGSSQWVEDNITALHGINAVVARSRLTPTSPRTLDELGGDLERMMAQSPAPRELYRVSRVVNGATDAFEFDVGVWRGKLAAASAALTIASVHDHNHANPDKAVGFFLPEATVAEHAVAPSPQGAQVALPGQYTAAALARQVAPALDFITARAGGLGLSASELEDLTALFRERTEDYAARYSAALRAYYDSFHFEAGSEEALPFALAALGQPSSWFLRFLVTVSTNATPALGEGPFYDLIAESLTDFLPLAELLAVAKGTIPGLAPYQQLVAELATALSPAPSAAASGEDGGEASEPPTLAGELSPSGLLTLHKLTGAEKDRLAQVTGWLTGANIDRSLHAPFLAPVEEVYAFGTSAINRALGRAWSTELWPLVTPLLARFPFRVSATEDVAVADLEAVVRSQGKQPGSFWSAFQRWLGPVTVQRNGQYTMLRGVSAPAGALAAVNDLARLARALWDDDGNPIPLPIKITPQPLDASVAGGRVPTLAYLRSGSSAIYAFNQRPGSSTLALQWWDQGVSSIIVKMSKPGASDAASYSIDEADSTFSFHHLLCRARRPVVPRAQAPEPSCALGKGARIWDVPLGGAATRSVTLTLDNDPWALFRIGR